MIFDKPIQTTSVALTLEALAEAEAEERAALEAMRTNEAVDAYRSAQETMLTGQLKRLPYSNYALWRELSPIRRKLLLDFAVGQMKELEERIAFMSRQIIVGELELPDNLREGSDIPLRAVR